MTEKEILEKLIKSNSPNVSTVMGSSALSLAFIYFPFNWKYIKRNQLSRISPLRHLIPCVPSLLVAPIAIRLSVRDNLQNMINSEKLQNVPDSHVKNIAAFYKIENEAERKLKIAEYVKANGVRELNPIRKKFQWLMLESLYDYSNL